MPDAQTKKVMNQDLRVLIAELSAKVTKVDDDYSELRSTVIQLSRHIDDVGQSINDKIDAIVRPQWQTYISAGGLMFAMLAALWGAGISPIKETQIARGAVLERLTDFVIKNDKELVSELKRVDEKYAEIIRSRILPRPEHEEFSKRLMDNFARIDDRIKLIDGSRPTAGELQAIARNSESVGNKLDERVRDLERKVGK